MTNGIVHTKKMAPGTPIANSRGVPGTLGCIAWSKRKEKWVGLTCGHVLMGKNGQTNEEFWKVQYSAAAKFKCYKAGRTLSSRIGTVSFKGLHYFIDSATCSFSEGVHINHFLASNNCFIRGSAAAVLGERVTKIGAATGLTHGILTSATHADQAYIDNRSYEAPNQLLLAPADRSTVFCAPGDSGSVILNRNSQVIGILWGTTGNGEGVACPVAPVLTFLGIEIKEKPLNFWERMAYNINKLHGNKFT